MILGQEGKIMKNKRNKSNDVKFGEIYSAWYKVKNAWKIFGLSFIHPLVIIPLGFTVLILWAVNTTEIGKTFSVILQIVATLFTAIAGSLIYDSIKNALGKNLLSKKGLSAVRNLSLVRLKIKSLSDRVEKNISIEETNTSLSLLGKDIANAIQEWNDILPGVGRIEEVYVLLAEKEEELKIREIEKEQLEKRIKKERDSGAEEKKNLEKTLSEKEEEISKLSLEINRLDSQTLPLTLGKTESILGSILGSTPLGMPWSQTLCSKCGNLYTPTLGDQGLCLACESRLRIALARIRKNKEGEEAGS